MYERKEETEEEEVGKVEGGRAIFIAREEEKREVGQLACSCFFFPQTIDNRR